MSFTTTSPNLFLTEEEQAATKSTVANIARAGHLRLESDGLTYSLHPYAAQKIVDMLGLIAEGQEVEVVPARPELTVAQTAKFLGISEACVEELIENDVLEFRRDGDQRWIKRDSVLDHESETREMSEGLDEIVRLSQEMGLYD